MNNDELDQQATKRREDSSEQPSPGAGEQSLRDEITRLQREAQEKNQILQDRNDELVRVKAQLDHLSDRMAQLESSSTRDENSFHDEADQMRNEFQAQLALLQAELSQREWALEERQAKAHSVEQDLRQELDTVRRRLAAKNAADQAARDFVFDAPDANHAPEETFELNGGNQSTAPGSFASHRRWNRGLNWKRRWRS